MREILFRGKRSDNGEWVKGCLLYDSEQNEGYIAENFEDKSAYIREVFPETVGQFTGLTDKNGKKIFEGDIVKLTLKDGVEFGEIDWSDYYMRFTFVSPEGRYGFDSDCVFEVIGNIHDNPELLKDGAK